MLKNSWWLPVLLFALAACDGSPAEHETKAPAQTRSYDHVLKVREGNGKKPKDGDLMLMHIVFTKPNGDTLFSSLPTGLPAPIMYTDSLLDNPGGIEDAFRRMRMGDSVHAQVTAGNLYSNTYKQPLPAGVNAADTLHFSMGLATVMPPNLHNVWLTFAQLPKSSKQTQEDIATIKAHLQKEGKNLPSTPSGLHYEIISPGQGANPAYGQYVKINYVAKVLSTGYTFDTNVAEVAERENLYSDSQTYEPMQVFVGDGQFFWGLDESLTLLRPGGVGRFYLPSELAFGKQKRGAFIEPNSILVMEIEMVDFVYP